jgi:hypothetical protein
MKRKPTFSAVLLLLALSAFSGSVFAQANLAAKLDVKSIKSIQFAVRGNTLYADTIMIVTNSAENELKLRKINFTVQMKSGDLQIPMGTAETSKIFQLVEDKEGKIIRKPDEILFGVGSTQKPVEVVLELQVKVGSKNLETMQRLIGMFNVIGNPMANFSMLLNGEGEVGVKAKKGWIYQSGISVEWVFTPKVQKEVLF